MLAKITDGSIAATMREIHTMSFSFIPDPLLTPYRLNRMITGNRHEAFGYFMENSLIGFLFVDHESEIALPGVCIEHFAVLPWKQSAGVGSSILSYVINDVYPELFFHMRVDNKKMHLVAFYMKHGFVYHDDKYMILERRHHVKHVNL